jgi:serine O-acetyltransferase
VGLAHSRAPTTPTFRRPDLVGDNVTLYPHVTIGRADIWRDKAPDFSGCIVGDEAIICVGAIVLSKHGVLRIGKGTVVGANAVLTQSTGDGEVWAGVPARKIGVRTG